MLCSMLSTVTRFVAVGGRLTAVEVQQSGVFFRETPRAAAVTGTAAGDGGTELCVFRARARLCREALCRRRSRRGLRRRQRSLVHHSRLHGVRVGLCVCVTDCVTVRSMVNIARLTIWSIYCSRGQG